MNKSDRDTIDMLGDTMRENFPTGTKDVLIILVDDADDNTVTFTFKGRNDKAAKAIYEAAKEHDNFAAIIIAVGQRLALQKLKGLINNLGNDNDDD
jgi:hypothetical protein